MPIVKLPDGQSVQFPDDMPVSEIKSLIANKFPNEVAQAQASRPDMSSSLPGMVGDFQNTSRAFQSGATQGMTLGFGDELEAGLLAVPEAIGGMMQGRGFDLGQGYNQALDRARGANVSSKELNPTANVAGNITGNMVLASRMPSMMAGASPTIGSMAGRGAAEGLIYGALTGLGEGESLPERLQGAATGGTIGGLLGGGLGAIGGSLANRSAAAAAPTAESLGAAKDAAYQSARQSGAVFTEDLTQELADSMALAAQDARINDLTAPVATGMLQRIQGKAGQPMTVGEIEDMRIFLNQLVGGSDANEARIAKAMIRGFDDTMASLKPADFSGGNAVAAMENISEGRRLFSTQKKVETIEGVIQKAADMSSANYTASGYENALRQQFKNLLTNPNALKGFSDAEKAAIRQVASGGPVENVLRWVGKFSAGSPFSAGLTVGGPAALVANATDPMTGLAVGGALLGAGTLARKAATASTLNNANLARALIASGGQMPAVPSVLSGVAQSLVPAVGSQSGGNINEALRRALLGN